jgi:hypothetical protein
VDRGVWASGNAELKRALDNIDIDRFNYHPDSDLALAQKAAEVYNGEVLPVTTKQTPLDPNLVQ